MNGDKGMAERQGEADCAWTVEISIDDFLKRAFSSSEKGELLFGWSGVTSPGKTVDSLWNWVTICDYVMEGFVHYELRVGSEGRNSLLELKLHGTNRDEYVPRQIHFYLEQSGLKGLIQKLD
ncbi:hypothetical protein Pla108_11910 [Botrimarina colliarenosi]|uniref:Uncharacterized protein n=1 Tax=Botrimarina colliarenosi TaxID=2528001 RepID=A0A5C6APW9_9BACT|nr:hypothetical protein Pla108_11910 [Botrimarina colliarenosi]